jgi:signal transduction histidine kinase
VEVIAEYAALRAVVLAIVLEHTEREHLAPTIVAVSGAFDSLVTRAIARYELEHERIRERFVSMLVHDLRDPLTAVMMSANLLADMTLGQRQSQMVGRITRGARRIERMVDEVVDFARTRVGEGSTIAISPGKVDIGEVCHEAIGEARALPSAREIALDLSGDLHGTWDRERVRQALTSLIANATQAGQGAIHVRAGESSDRSAVITSVTNRGPVLSSDLLNRIFDPFGRALLDPSRVRGLGLGLYLVEQIARAHGGSAKAASNADQGTVFTVEWPRR